MALIEKVCLYYQDGTSDKVYEIHLTAEDDGYRVTGYNGRRGTKLVAQPKTPRPVPYRTARYIFDNLEASKLNHRRTPYRVASRETAENFKNTMNSVNASIPPTRKISDQEQPQGYSASFLEALEL
jgi:hypothetical protein